MSLSLLALATVSCNSRGGGSSSNSVTPVLPYCDTVTTYTGGITIDGTANYLYRTNGSGAVAAPRPIRYAEVRVINADGEVIQCGETTNLGAFSVSLPKNDETVTLQVNARASNSEAVAYVLANPFSNALHSLTAEVTLSADQTLSTLTAQATGDVLGGAFNILDQIINANTYLKTETANCNANFTPCQPFTVAPLVTIYWSMGINPASYFGGFSPLSFYLPGDRQLYILGGVSGDVNNSDTDHFDNSIILHEYAHFLEDVYSVSNSPGGSHNGNSIIDPRLAWGEGFANYFQAAVTGNPVYLDTSGNIDGTAQNLFNENIETPGQDIPVNAGEGIFREFSISRALWDITDPANEMAGSVDTVASSFAEIWAIFNGTNQFPSSSLNFRNMGLFHVLHDSLTGGGVQAWGDIQTAEKQPAHQKNYANTLTLQAGACTPSTVTIADADISAGQPENGSFANSNQLASNDFYQYAHPGGAFSVAMSYTTSGANTADLDLIVYDSDYTFGSKSDVVAISESTISAGQTSGNESISLPNLAAGTYMINVMVYTGARKGTSSNYNLTLNGQNACPN